MTPGRLWKVNDYAPLTSEPHLGYSKTICEIVPGDIVMFIETQQPTGGLGIWFWKVLHGRSGKVGYIYTLGVHFEDMLSDLKEEPVLGRVK